MVAHSREYHTSEYDFFIIEDRDSCAFYRFEYSGSIAILFMISIREYDSIRSSYLHEFSGYSGVVYLRSIEEISWDEYDFSRESVDRIDELLRIFARIDIPIVHITHEDDLLPMPRMRSMDIYSILTDLRMSTLPECIDIESDDDREKYP